MSLNYWLSEEQFSKIKPLLPNKSRGVPRVDDRRVLSGIIFCLERGYRWSDVPAKTLYNRYKRWSTAGVFERILRPWLMKTANCIWFVTVLASQFICI